MKSLFAFFFFFHLQEILIELSTQRKSTRSQWIFLQQQKNSFNLQKKKPYLFFLLYSKKVEEMKLKWKGQKYWRILYKYRDLTNLFLDIRLNTT